MRQTPRRYEGLAGRDTRLASDTTIDVAVALLGDADLDNEVAFADFLRLSANFGEEGSWVDGDFDGSGRIEFGDFLLLSGNFGASSMATASVPEPDSLGVLLLAISFATAAFRKRRQHHWMPKN